MTTQYRISIDDIFQSTPIGSIDKAIGNNLYGFNHDQTPSAVPGNKEHQGYVFFVRPQLNLQLDNIRNTRKLMPLASDSSNLSIHRFIRTTLDPRLMYGYNFKNISVPAIECPLTNNEMAFIPVLTNNLLRSSGWPDPIVPMFTSRAGRYNESVSMIDGLVENYETYTLDMMFRNTMMDPILYMFYIWSLYGSYVFQGKMLPYPDFITENRIDYNTRIFRIRLDKTKSKVTKIMSTGPAIPMASSVGQYGDFNIEEPINDQNKDITIRFQCTGFEIFDDILIYEFNKIVQMFKVGMRDEFRDQIMVLIPRQISYMFQHRAYPRINPNTHAMEWWVDKTLFDIRTLSFIQTLQASSISNGIEDIAEEIEPLEGIFETIENVF